MLAEYGEHLPDFIAGIEELEDYGYLQDMARLENAWNRALHSRNAVPLGPAELSGMEMTLARGPLFYFSAVPVPGLQPLPVCAASGKPTGMKGAVVQEVDLDDGPDHILLYRPESACGSHQR